MSSSLLSPFRYRIGSNVAAALQSKALVPTNALATGGTVTIDTPTLVEHQFLGSGTFNLINPGSLLVDYFVLGGGGGAGGGAPSANYPTGGAGGTARSGTNLIINANQTVTVGAGGTAGGNNVPGGAGGTSSIGALVTANGGEGGGTDGNGFGGDNDDFIGGVDGTNPLSGAGAGAGGNASGGAHNFNGGIGVEWPASSGNFYGGGGCGQPSVSTNGTAVHGGGAGANGVNGKGGGGGGYLTWYTGGSGIVIIRYDPTNYAKASGGTIILNTPSSVVHEFTANGTFLLDWPGILPISFTISGTGTVDGVGTSGTGHTFDQVAVTVTSGTVEIEYDPTELILAALWIDAADTSTITDSSGTVTAFGDKSQSNKTVTVAGTPQTNASTINGHNVIDVVAANGDNFLTEDFLMNAGDFTTVSVGDFSTTTTGVLWMSERGATNPRFRLYSYDASNTQWRFYNDGGGTSFNVTNTPGFGAGLSMWTARSEQGASPELEAWEDGVSRITVASYTPAVNQIAVDWMFPIDGSGKWCQVCAFTVALSPAYRAALEAHLRAKWGVT